MPIRDFLAELAQIQAESTGWIPLDKGAYLHVGSDTPMIQVVGIAKEETVCPNVLWLTLEAQAFSTRLALCYPTKLPSAPATARITSSMFAEPTSATAAE